MRNYVDTYIAANLFREKVAFVGRLYFDETGMTFLSPSPNFSADGLRIEYSDIENAAPKNLYGFAPTGMCVFTKDGSEYKFAVFHRKELIEFLMSR